MGERELRTPSPHPVSGHACPSSHAPSSHSIVWGRWRGGSPGGRKICAPEKAEPSVGAASLTKLACICFMTHMTLLQCLSNIPSTMSLGTLSRRRFLDHSLHRTPWCSRRGPLVLPFTEKAEAAGISESMSKESPWG